MALQRNGTRRSLAKVAVLCALAGFGFYAAQPQAGAPEVDVVLTEGAFSQSNSRDGAAILSASDMRPGDVRQGTVTIANTGTLPGTFSLSKSNLVDDPGPGGGALSARLDLLVEDVTAAPQTIYAGKLGAMAESAAGSFPSGQARTFRFTVSFPTGAGDNAYRGSRTSVQYDWNATSSEDGGNPPPPDPEPEPDPPVIDPPAVDPPVTAPPPAPQPPPAPADTTPPVLTLGGKAKQKVHNKAVFITARCSEVCNLTAAATMSGVPKASKLKIRPVTARGAEGWELLLKLRLSKAAVKAVKKRRKGTVTVAVTASDDAGNAVSASRRVKLRR